MTRDEAERRRWDFWGSLLRPKKGEGANRPELQTAERTWCFVCLIVLALLNGLSLHQEILVVFFFLSAIPEVLSRNSCISLIYILFTFVLLADDDFSSVP